MHSANENIDFYIKVYDSVGKLKNLSMHMNKINSAFIKLKESLNESQLEEFLIKKIQQYESADQIISFEDLNLEKIIENLEKSLEIISDFFEPKGIIKGIFNYLTNDSFGSIYEMRQKLICEFKCVDTFLITKDNKKLETYINYF